MKSLIALSISLLLLVGCSNGSSGGSSPSPTPEPTPAAAQFAYVLNTGSNSVSSFAIKDDGSLTSLSVAVATGDFPRSMVMDKVKNVIYVGNLGSASISHFAINSDGSLTSLGEVAADGVPDALVISPDHRFLYALISMNGEIAQFSIATDGTLTPTAKIPHADGAVGMVFSPSGTYAYVVSLGTTDLTQYSVGSDGLFTALSPATVASHGCPSGPIASKKATDGSEHVYTLSCSTNEVETYKIESSGQLTSQQVIATGEYPTSMTIVAGNLFVNNLADPSVSAYSILSNGLLQAESQSSTSAGLQTEVVAVDAARKFAYVLDAGSDQVLPYTVGASQSLSPMTISPIATESFPTQILLK